MTTDEAAEAFLKRKVSTAHNDELRLPRANGGTTLAAGEPTMKAVIITLPDDQAAALERAVAEGAFASPSEFVVAAIEDYLAAPVDYDRETLTRDVAQHEAEKARGDAGYSADQARAWLGAARLT
jgi:Arc/MetJ-type ribon-helix-helix transcriptional regulator